MTDVNEQIPSYSYSFLHAFFFLKLSCVTSFFLFFSRLFFSFFLLPLFSELDISPFLSDWCRICSSCFWPFFSWSWVVLLLFFLYFSRLPFFFFWGCAVLILFFGAGHFPFSFWGVPNLFFVFLVSFPCFLFSGALCFLSLSLDRLNKPLRNRFLLVLSRFSDHLRGTMVTQS